MKRYLSSYWLKNIYFMLSVCGLILIGLIRFCHVYPGKENIILILLCLGYFATTAFLMNIAGKLARYTKKEGNQLIQFSFWGKRLCSLPLTADMFYEKLQLREGMYSTQSFLIVSTIPFRSYRRQGHTKLGQICKILDQTSNQIFYPIVSKPVRSLSCRPGSRFSYNMNGSASLRTCSTESIAFPTKGGATLIPKHLSPHLNQTAQKITGGNEYTIRTLTCCQTNHFELSILGEVRRRIFSRMQLEPLHDRTVLAARCKHCGKSLSLFDSDCDGYDHCGEKKRPWSPSDSLHCRRCQQNDFSVRIQYEYPDMQELQSLEISEPDRAFTWIWITLTCNQCGAKYKNFVDFETG